jgi:hypothetical protein
MRNKARISVDALVAQRRWIGCCWKAMDWLLLLGGDCDATLLLLLLRRDAAAAAATRPPNDT